MKTKILWIDLNCSYAHASLALPALHAGRQPAVQPVQQCAGQRGQQQVQDHTDSLHHNAPPITMHSMTTSVPAETMTDGRISRRMPNSKRIYQLLRYKCSGSP